VLDLALPKRITSFSTDERELLFISIHYFLYPISEAKSIRNFLIFTQRGVYESGFTVSRKKKSG